MNREKICHRCKEIKMYEDFYVMRAHKTGRTPYCKKCSLERSREQYKGITRHHIIERGKEYSKNITQLRTVNYLKKLLKDQGFSEEQITPELIKLQNVKLKFLREIKKQEKDGSQGTT